jgi:hypothetical protein
MGLEDEAFSIRVLLRHCLVNDKFAIGTPQHRLALLHALPCYLRTPAQQNFT